MRRRALLLLALVLMGCSQAVSSAPGSSTPSASPAAVAVTPSPGTASGPIGSAKPIPAASRAPNYAPTVYVEGDVVAVTTNTQPWGSISVTRASEVDRYGGPTTKADVPKKGYDYLQAFVTYTSAKDAMDYNESDWMILDNDIAVAGAAKVLNGPAPRLGSGILPKGSTTTGWVVFQVPKTGKVVMSYQGAFSNGISLFEVLLRAK